MQIIIPSPSLNPQENVSGVSSITQFIIENNTKHEYIHFVLGKKDNERGGIFRLRAIIKTLWKWNKLLKAHPNALIHYNFPLNKPSLLRDPLFMTLARWHKRKLVVHIHGGLFLTQKHIPFPFKQIAHYVFSWQIPFIVLSEIEVKTLKDRFKVQQIFTLPNCVDMREAINYRKIINKSQPLVLGYLGRITETKGMDYLLKACKELAKKDIPFLLRIAGSEEIKDEYIPTFKAQLGKRFDYVGLVSGKQKNDFLKSLDIFVMPTFFEGLPMSLLESMSYGVVPIITPVGSIESIVTNEKNGIIVPIKDIDHIVTSIIKLHFNRELLYNLSQNAKECIFSQFCGSNYIDRLNEIYWQEVNK